MGDKKLDEYKRLKNIADGLFKDKLKTNFLLWIKEMGTYLEWEKQNRKVNYNFSRGEIILANFGWTVGKELGGPNRPCIVIETANQKSETLVVIPLSKLKDGEQCMKNENICLGKIIDDKVSVARMNHMRSISKYRIRKDVNGKFIILGKADTLTCNTSWSCLEPFKKHHCKNQIQGSFVQRPPRSLPSSNSLCCPPRSSFKKHRFAPLHGRKYKEGINLSLKEEKLIPTLNLCDWLQRSFFSDLKEAPAKQRCMSSPTPPSS
jgi:mRNA-degrading endonuclease toxin of MazEF toxin-antitoxin module